MGNYIKIDVSELSDAIQKSLNKYHIETTCKIKELTEKEAKELTKNTKRDSPVKTGEYKKHISCKKTFENNMSCTYTWYVKNPEYRLTYLIAKGHKKRNHKGSTKSNDFLEKNVLETQANYIKKVKEICENGS